MQYEDRIAPQTSNTYMRDHGEQTRHVLSMGQSKENTTRCVIKQFLDNNKLRGVQTLVGLPRYL